MPKIQWTLDLKKASRRHLAVQRPYPRTILRPLRYSVQIAVPVAAGYGTDAKAPEVIPISVSPAPLGTDTAQQHVIASVPITLHLPCGIQMYYHNSQLTDVFRALRYADV